MPAVLPRREVGEATARRQSAEATGERHPPPNDVEQASARADLPEKGYAAWYTRARCDQLHGNARRRAGLSSPRDVPAASAVVTAIM